MAASLRAKCAPRTVSLQAIRIASNTVRYPPIPDISRLRPL